MALDLPLPRNVLVHGHWTMNREKMSKSTGNVVNPFFAIERFGVDTMRFFLTFQGGLSSDANYDNAHIIRAYKKYLQQGLGNTVHRTIGVAKGDLRPFIRQGLELPETDHDREYQKGLVQLPALVEKRMGKLDPRTAIVDITSFILMVSLHDFLQ